MNDSQDGNPKPTLIYFKVRGNAQIIRCVLLQIGVQFDEIFVAGNGYLDPALIDKYKIDLKYLPYFIHGDLVLVGVFPIIKYLCTCYNRLDLLGKTVQDSLFITEFMVKQLREKGLLLHTWFKGIQEVGEKNQGQQGIIAVTNKILEVTMRNNITKPLKAMFAKTKGFLLGYLTVVDFVYYEKAFYASNTITAQLLEMNEVKLYGRYFESTEFYLNNEATLSKYKVFFPLLDERLNSLVMKMWLGDPKYITSDP